MIRERIRANASKLGRLAASRPTGKVNYALDGDQLACCVHDRCEPILYLNPCAVGDTYEIVQRSSPSVFRGSVHLFIDAAPVEGRDQVGKCDALVRDESMRVVTCNVTTTGADEFHRPLCVMTSSVDEAADVAHQAFERSAAIGAREVGNGMMERRSHDAENVVRIMK